MIINVVNTHIRAVNGLTKVNQLPAAELGVLMNILILGCKVMRLQCVLLKIKGKLTLPIVQCWRSQ